MSSRDYLIHGVVLRVRILSRIYDKAHWKIAIVSMECTEIVSQLNITCGSDVAKSKDKWVPPGTLPERTNCSSRKSSLLSTAGFRVTSLGRRRPNSSDRETWEIGDLDEATLRAKRDGNSTLRFLRGYIQRYWLKNHFNWSSGNLPTDFNYYLNVIWTFLCFSFHLFI